MLQIAFIPFSFPDLPRVGCVFTSLQGGLSKYPYFAANLSFDVGDDPALVRANRDYLKDRLGLDELVDCTQVHGNELIFDLEPGVKCQADGLATQRLGIGLMIKTADCQPIMLTHESGRFVVGLHVGWRGNVIDFPGTGVRLICEKYGCKPAELLAVRGPSLGPQQAEFINFRGEFGSGFASYFNPATQTADLWQLTRDQLVAAGLLPERVFGVDMCTKSTPELFFSFRAKKTTGRQAAIIWIKPQ